MKKIVVLCIILAILAAGCATLALSPEERILAREFNKLALNQDEVNFIRSCGFNEKHLTARQKAYLMREGNALAGYGSVR